MDRHRHAQGAINGFEFLASQAEGDIVHALAAVFDWKTNPQDTEFAHALQHPGNWFTLAIVLLDNGSNFLLSEVAYHFLRHQMFVGKGKVHVEAPEGDLSYYNLNLKKNNRTVGRVIFN